MNIGKIHKLNLNGDEKLKAVIKMRTLSLECFLEENEFQNSDASPKYRIVEINPQGDEVEIGAAWEKRPKSGGDPYLSLSIDDPSFEKPIHLYAFKKGEGHWDIVWQRPRQRTVKAIEPLSQNTVSQENSA